jgi:hypothetical protein
MFESLFFARYRQCKPYRAQWANSSIFIGLDARPEDRKNGQIPDAMQTPAQRESRDSLRSGLRLCRTCGHVGCCDDSKNRHARKHFLSAAHPIISSFEPGEDWSWCFIDEMEVVVP